MHEQLARMRAIAERHGNGARQDTPLPRVAVHVGCTMTKPTPGVYEPALCLVLQGAKQILIGDRTLRYDPASYFIATIDLPACGWVVEASPARPYVAVSMKLDRSTLSSLILDVPGGSEGETAGFAVSAVTPDLLDAWSRLLALLDRPEDVPVLAPIHEREILYRLLRGPQGGVLRQIARSDSRLSQIRQAIGWIRAHFDRTLRVEQLADLAGMSPASFHRHFKAATAMSPLQYQKTLRLQEARRLLVSGGDAARAAHMVGYESASQFSREYARMFGAPPARDAGRLRETGIAQVGEAADA
ncbi:AraC family transcriptional regulator [Sphingomonas nostoxanthinifaciens]|uniref:AraC family transcriptional regulator n=1 Tax=Sphingomonas nostoxanthinifaciens TaxID=2872652 RepID=UPI001CC21280|nr:AraC family transcriptional regulator [Sphingomonas nostoxanthinifaciens]UAK23142.1 AraC family transcriptional regulator [Sphingomonas nostoxanthinifaciens]